MFKRSAGLLGRADSPATRKKLKTSNGDALKDEGGQMLAVIERLAEKKTQRAIASEFQKLPSRKLYPDYYQLIKKPIALDVIRQNLDDGEYVTLDMLKEDLLQMCNNAKRYNQRGSMLYADASQIERVVKKWSGDPENYSDDSDSEEIVKDNSIRTYRFILNQTIKGILRDLREAKDRSGRRYADIFLELPDKKLYPDYYTLITNPMSLNSIEGRMKKNPYPAMEKFQEHLDQMWENAYTYNDMKSQVAVDAKYLQKLAKRLITEANQRIDQQEKEIAEETKAIKAKSETRTPKSGGKGSDSAPSGGFKIKLGLRQPSSTPATTPGPKIKLNVRSHIDTNKSRDSPASSPLPVEASTPVPRKSATPVPRQSATPAPVQEEIKTEESKLEDSKSSQPGTPAAARDSSMQPNTETTPGPNTAPNSTLAPNNVFEAPIIYANAGAPLIQCLSLCASQIQPPTILHLPAIPGQASLLYSWSLPIAASAMTISPSLCPTLLSANRGYSLTMALNGRKVIATRHSGGMTPIKNSIWDLKLSAGMNCIECIVEASSQTLPSDETEGKQSAEPDAQAVDTDTPAETSNPTVRDVNFGKDRERLVVMAFLR